MNKTKLLVITGLSCTDRELLSPLGQAGLVVESATTIASGLSACLFPAAHDDATNPLPAGASPAGLPVPDLKARIQRYLEERPEQSLLAWADTRTALLLSRWHDAGPELRFLFVYQPPWRALGTLLQDHRAFGASPAQAPGYWLNYNRELIHYYTRHKSDCLLLNTAYPESLRAGLIPTINRQFGLELQNTVTPDAAIPDPEVTAANIHAFLLGQIAPECIELYLELESCADLLGRQPDFDCQKQLMKLPEAPVFFGDWAAQLQGENKAAERLARVEDNLAGVEADNRNLRQQLHDLERTGEQVRVKWNGLRLTMEEKLKQLRDLESAHSKVSKLHQEAQARLEQTGQETERKHKELRDKLEEHEQESELLLLQLHQVQEELEHYFLENQRLETQLAADKKQQEQDRTQQLEHARKNLQEKEQLLSQGAASLRAKEQQLARMETLYAEASGLLEEYRETLRKARYSISTLYKSQRVTPERTLM